MKFGGTSVQDADAIRQVAELVRTAAPKKVLVVVSAAGKTTSALFNSAGDAERGDLAGALERLHAVQNHHAAIISDLFDDVPKDLQDFCKICFDEVSLLLQGVSITHELTPRTLDAIASTGELLSSKILAHFLNAKWVNARQLMTTDKRFGAAQPMVLEVEKNCRHEVEPHLSPDQAVVTQGYIGSTEDGVPTTLGREGSDYSAALFGAGLNACEIQIWTDVEGILTCDPRLLEEAIPIPEMSFDEASALATAGAKVLHPSTIKPAQQAGIPVTVRCTKKPSGRFTRISHSTESTRPVTGIAIQSPVGLLSVHSSSDRDSSRFLFSCFDALRSNGIEPLIASFSHSSLTVVMSGEPATGLLDQLTELGKTTFVGARAVVNAVGARLGQTPGSVRQLLNSLGDLPIDLVYMGANDTTLSICIPEVLSQEALVRLHRVLEGMRV